MSKNIENGNENSKAPIVIAIIAVILILGVLAGGIAFMAHVMFPKVSEPEETVVVEEPKEEEPTESETAAEIKETVQELTCDELILNGVRLTMIDMTATDVEEALGIDFDDEIMAKEIKQSKYECITYHPGGNEDYIANFYFFNVKKDPRAVADCILCGVQLHNSKYLEGETLAKFATFDVGSGITEKTTEDELVEILGAKGLEAAEFDEGKKRGLTRYDYHIEKEDGSKRDFEVNFNDEGFYELQIGYF